MSSQDKFRTLEEVTTIRFPQSIIPHEVGELLGYVAERLDCIATYQEEVKHNLHLSQDEVVHNRETVKIDGQISRVKSFSSVQFSLTRTLAGGISRYSGMRFFTAPGYGIDEINPEELSLMTNLKELVRDYFEKQRVRQ